MFKHFMGRKSKIKLCSACVAATIAFSSVPVTILAEDSAPSLDNETVIESVVSEEPTTVETSSEPVVVKDEDVDVDENVTSIPEDSTEPAEVVDETEVEPPVETTADETAAETTADETSETTSDNSSSDKTPAETTSETSAESTEEPVELVVFDHFYSQIDSSDVRTKELLIQTSDPSVFTYNTNVVSNYDDVYVVSCASVREARFVYSYYVTKVDNISDLSNVFSVASESDDTADLSDLNDGADAIANLNDIDTAKHSGYIALIDTGADADINYSVVGDDTSDTNGHGTAMLGYIREVNPNARVISIKVFEGGKTNAANVYAGIKLAIESDVSIINLSFVGSDIENNVIVKEAIQEAIDNGITVIGAAGNSNNDATKYIPGCIADVITVGAVNEDGSKYSSSNYNADLYVIATSTSEAAARYTGMYSVKSFDGVFDSFTSSGSDTAPATNDDDLTIEELPEDVEIVFLVSEGWEYFDDYYAWVEHYSDGSSIEYTAAYGTLVFDDFNVATGAPVQNKGKTKVALEPGLSGTDYGTLTYSEGSRGKGTIKNAKSTTNGAYTLAQFLTGSTTLNVECEGHFNDATHSHYASVLNNSGTKHYKTHWSTSRNSDGSVSIVFDYIYISDDSTFSVSWANKSEKAVLHMSSNYYTANIAHAKIWVTFNNKTYSIYDGNFFSSEGVTAAVVNSIVSKVSGLNFKKKAEYSGIKDSELSKTSSGTITSWINSNLNTSSSTAKTATKTVATNTYKQTSHTQIYDGAAKWTFSGVNMIVGKRFDEDYIVLVDRNACYSLKNTTYGLYSGYNSSTEDVTGDPIEEFVMDAGGACDTVYAIETFPATFYMKETQAGKGFALDPDIYKIYVKSATDKVQVTNMATGKTEEISISGGGFAVVFEDEPVSDPISLGVKKVTEQGQISTASVASPTFRLEYYAQSIAWADATADYDPTVVYEFTLSVPAGTTERLLLSDFVGKTPVDGTDKDYLKNLYNANVLPSARHWPLGTYRIYEQVAPDGFETNQQVVRVKLYQEENGDEEARIIHKIEDRNGNQVAGGIHGVDGDFYNYTLDRSGDEYDDVFFTLDDNFVTAYYQLTKSMSDDSVITDLADVFDFELYSDDGTLIATGKSQADGTVLWTYQLDDLKSAVDRHDLKGTTTTKLELAVYHADGVKIEYEVRETVPAYPYGGTSTISYTQAVPEGWELSDDGTYYVKTFTLDDANTIDAPYEDTIVNDLESGSFNLVKSIPDGDEFDRTKVAFKLYYGTTLIANGSADANGNITWTKVHTANYTGLTESVNSVSGLPFGDYRVVESWDKTFIEGLNGEQVALIENNLSGWTPSNNANIYEFYYDFTIDSKTPVDITNGEVVNEEEAQYFNLTKTTTVAGDASTVKFDLVYDPEGSKIILATGTATTTEQPGEFGVTWNYTGVHKTVDGLDTIKLPAGDYAIREYVPTTYYQNGKDNVPYTYMTPACSVGDADLAMTSGTYNNKEVFTSAMFTIENNETVTATSTMSNTRIEGELSVIKVERSDDTSTDKTFNFEIYYRGNGAKAENLGEFLNEYLLDTVTITTQNGEGTATLNKIPEGWYEIREVDNDGWEVTWGGTGSVSTGVKAKLFRVDSEDKTIDTPVVNDGVEENGTPIDGLLVYNDIAPEIGTTLVDSRTRAHIAATDVEAKLIDTVAYKRVLPGSYKILGVLMDKATGEPLIGTDGREVRGSAKLVIPTEGNLDRFGNPVPVSGTKDVEFTLDTTTIKGLKAVAFEELYEVDVHGEVIGAPVAEHEDLNDVDQTVDIGDGKTELIDEATETHTTALAESVTLVDYVEFNHLIPGRTYTITGTLMDEATGQPLLDAEGNPITSSQPFTATEDDENIVDFVLEDGSVSGLVKVTFTIDTTILVGKTNKIVAFETCYDDESGVAVFIHADLEDKPQTVDVPTAITKAFYSDGSKSVPRTSSVKLIDTISYTGLTPGRTYKIVTTLMLKSTNAPLDIEPFVTTFTPESADGVTEVVMTFDATGLTDDDQVVVFEKVYDLKENVVIDDETGEEKTETEEILVAEHEDINDQDQTVGFMPKTGDNFNLVGYIVAAVASVAALAGLTIFVIKRKKNTGSENG